MSVVEATDSLDVMVAKMAIELEWAAMLLFQKETVHAGRIGIGSYDVHKISFFKEIPLVRLSHGEGGGGREIKVRVAEPQMLYPVKVVVRKYIPQLDGVQIETTYDGNRLGAAITPVAA